MTPGQTHPRRRGLNELMESVAAKLAERPDHIAAARVLEEMQADAAKISHKADGVDVQNGQSEMSSSSSSSLPPIAHTLNKKCITSPSLTTYSLPSVRRTPAVRQAASVLYLT